jgi:NADPH:quinone reductase-like Zn-dependent oxidoreductase
MQACIVEAYGSADVVKVAEVDRPAPRADELLIRVRAASVTTADWRLRASAFPWGFRLAGRLLFGLFQPRNPILGMDFAGEVEAIGEQVTSFRPGQRVFGSTSPMRRAAHAEYVVVKQSDAVVLTPSTLRDADAAAIPFGGNAALAFLRDFGRLRAGQRVLVVGASGGVGVWAVQIARHLGAEVTAVTSARNVDLVRSLGAHHVVDYAVAGVTPRGETYDLIFDTVGVTTFVKVRHALSARGLYLPLNGGPREMWQALVTGFRGGQRVKYAVSKNTREGLAFLAGLVEEGRLRPVVDRVYPMQGIADAHRHVESRHKRGSVVVAMGASTSTANAS